MNVELPNRLLERSSVIEKTLRLECLTAAWMLIEAGVAIGSGIAAHSLTLIAFGADSVVELLSALLLLWRLTVELQQGEHFPQELEERAAKIGVALLLILSLYVVVSAAWALWQGKGQEFSLLGLILAVFTMPIMYAFAKAKLRLADELDSSALRSDAVESIACGYLSAVVVAGLIVQFFVNAWWIDGASALVLVPFLLREAKEAWQGEDE